MPRRSFNRLYSGKRGQERRPSRFLSDGDDKFKTDDKVPESSLYDGDTETRTIRGRDTNPQGRITKLIGGLTHDISVYKNAMATRFVSREIGGSAPNPDKMRRLEILFDDTKGALDDRELEQKYRTLLDEMNTYGMTQVLNMYGINILPTSIISA